MGFVVACGAAIMGLHAYIMHKLPQQRVSAEVVARAERLAQRKRHQQQQRRRVSIGSADVAPSSAGADPGMHWAPSRQMLKAFWWA